MRIMVEVSDEVGKEFRKICFTAEKKMAAVIREFIIKFVNEEGK